MSYYSFYKSYQAIYPNDLHLKYELRYFFNKYHVITKIISYLQKSGKKHVHMCDIGGGYGYDDLLIRKIADDMALDVTIDVDVIDPTSDFYNTVHHLSDSDIAKQKAINYREESFVHANLSKDYEKYDIVICCEVIEHLWTSEQEVFFANFNRILKKGGFIALSCPNGSTIFKGLFGIYTWLQKKNEIFEAEFHYRYSHIGVPTVFQVLGLFQRKGLQVQSIDPTALVSSTKISFITVLCNMLLFIFKYLNLFLSTDLVYTAIKTHSLDEYKRYNQKEIVLDNDAKVTLQI